MRSTPLHRLPLLLALAATHALSLGAFRPPAAESSVPRAPLAWARSASVDTLLVTPGDPPSDFAIALRGGEGRAIPGEYSLLDIRIDRAGRGTFSVEPSEPGSRAARGTFEVSDVVVRQLHRLSARLWNRRETGPVPHPGSVNAAGLILTGYGHTIRVDAPLREPWDTDARELSRQIRRAVPDSLWARAGHPSR